MMIYREISTDDDGRPLFDSAGNLVFLEGLPALKKAVSRRLNIYKGSAFWDRAAGINMSWLGSKGDISVAQSAIRAAIQKTPGVVDILEMDITLNSATRRLSGTIQVLSELGAVKVGV
jgi:hypothetical protein